MSCPRRSCTSAIRSLILLRGPLSEAVADDLLGEDSARIKSAFIGYDGSRGDLVAGTAHSDTEFLSTFPEVGEREPDNRGHTTLEELSDHSGRGSSSSSSSSAFSATQRTPAPSSGGEVKQSPQDAIARRATSGGGKTEGQNNGKKTRTTGAAEATAAKNRSNVAASRASSSTRTPNVPADADVDLSHSDSPSPRDIVSMANAGGSLGGRRRTSAGRAMPLEHPRARRRRTRTRPHTPSAPAPRRRLAPHRLPDWHQIRGCCAVVLGAPSTATAVQVKHGRRLPPRVEWKRREYL
mmetsp:Transcript_17195/g.42685  ORF Transcript_17195/g.42685 Transcript_17195/m.42685 type:complete len:295 (+) Transcript_17195:254-1138(+)